MKTRLHSPACITPEDGVEGVLPRLRALKTTIEALEPTLEKIILGPLEEGEPLEDVLIDLKDKLDTMMAAYVIDELVEQLGEIESDLAERQKSLVDADVLLARVVAIHQAVTSFKEIYDKIVDDPVEGEYEGLETILENLKTQLDESDTHYIGEQVDSLKNVEERLAELVEKILEAADRLRPEPKAPEEPGPDGEGEGLKVVDGDRSS